MAIAYTVSLTGAWMGKRAQSDFLFAQPTALSGAARLIDLGGTYDHYNESDEADSIALSSDWYVVGDDLFQSMSMVIPVATEQGLE